MDLSRDTAKAGIWVAGLALGLTVSAAGARAADLPIEDPPAAYAQCMDLAENRPRDGFGAAVSWEGLGGGEAARHCAAVALFHMGAFAEAASRLETLARESRQALPLRLDLLAQAGTAWLSAGRPGQAEAVLDSAIDLAARPDEGVPALLPGLLVDRATARADQGRDLEAARDLDRALDLRPGDAEALTLRATTLRRLGDLGAAAADAQAALAAHPDHPAALLESGNILRLQGDPDAARAVWLRLISVAPDGPEAAAARENLARLDVDAGDP